MMYECTELWIIGIESIESKNGIRHAFGGGCL